jgi:hypothetical protein
MICFGGSFAKKIGTLAFFVASRSVLVHEE